MFKQLALIRALQQGCVTYNFADGTKQVSQINNSIFYDDKGRKVDLNNVMKIFQTTAWDLKATSFTF
jgi:hypothetical protein